MKAKPSYINLMQASRVWFPVTPQSILSETLLRFSGSPWGSDFCFEAAGAGDDFAAGAGELVPLEAAVAGVLLTSVFHLLTRVAAVRATWASLFWRSLLTWTPIFVWRNSFSVAVHPLRPSRRASRVAGGSPPDAALASCLPRSSMSFASMVAMMCVCDCATAQCASLEVQSLSQVAQASNARSFMGKMRDESWCVQRCKETTISKPTWMDSSFGRWQLRKSIHDIEARGVVTFMQTTHLSYDYACHTDHDRLLRPASLECCSTAVIHVGKACYDDK
jgi:hypothetical protein